MAPNHAKRLTYSIEARIFLRRILRNFQSGIFSYFEIHFVKISTGSFESIKLSYIKHGMDGSLSGSQPWRNQNIWQLVRCPNHWIDTSFAYYFSHIFFILLDQHGQQFLLRSWIFFIVFTFILESILDI